MKELVSVVLPVWNARDTVGRAVASALEQTWRSIEVILVDDGSTDGSSEICRDLARIDSRITLLHKEDEGVSSARNLGLRESHGDWITFLDADDAMHPAMIEMLLTLQERTGADICGCSFQSVAPGESGDKEVSLHPVEPEILAGEEILTRGILQRDTRIWSKLIARELFAGPEGMRDAFYPGLTIGEDMLCLLDLAMEGALYARTETPLYLYTVNPMGAMERPFSPSYMDQIRCWEMARERAERAFPDAMEDPAVQETFNSIQAISASLVLQKIEKSEERRRWQPQRRQALEALKQVHRPGSLPASEEGKILLLTYFPALYRAIARHKR